MSETIEERYAKIAQRLRETSSNSQGFLFATAIKSLLDDLMAERGKMKDDISLLKRLLVQEIKETQVTDARFIEP